VSLDSYYRSNPGRWLELLCGIAIAVFALLALGLSVMLLLRAELSIGVLTAGLLLVGFGYWLGRLALRLLMGRTRVFRPLLSPAELMVGDSVLGLGGVLLLYIAATEREPKLAISALGILPVPYFAWRVARERRRQETPNKSLERSRDR